MTREPDVLIIGAGPAGLSAAAALKKLGIDDVLVVEREREAGGMPLFCAHATFGLAEYFRPMTGPRYAAKKRAAIDGNCILTSTTAVSVGRDLEVTVCSEQDGESILRPKRLLLATGIRETPRAARLISGDRPLNVLTTGALQRMLLVSHRLPFSRPVIIGTELVSFSAVLSLRDANVRPAAMIEPQARIKARKPADFLTRTFLRTPILLDTRLIRINAAADHAAKLASVTIERNGAAEELSCDAVIFTGDFVPEASLLGPHLGLCDSGSKGPAIDQHWQLADPRIYAAGNVLRPVETAAWAAREGTCAAQAIAGDLLSSTQRASRRIRIAAMSPIAFSTPSFLAVPLDEAGPLRLGLRMAAPARGCLVLAAEGKPLWRSRPMSLLPERRIIIEPALPSLDQAGEITLSVEPGR